MKVRARLLVKRFAPTMGTSGPRRVSVAYYGYQLDEVLAAARALKPEYRVGLWIEARGCPAAREKAGLAPI